MAAAEGDGAMLFKARALLLSLVALLLVGSIAAGAAYAEAGPFFKHREAGTKGEGETVEEPIPDEVQGEGGELRLKTKILGTAVEITAKGAQMALRKANTSSRRPPLK
jgi:hypothetical protein